MRAVVVVTVVVPLGVTHSGTDNTIPCCAVPFKFRTEVSLGMYSLQIRSIMQNNECRLRALVELHLS